MSPVSIQTLVFISYCSPVQGRMAGASVGVYEFGSVVGGQNICKSVWLTKHISASCRKTKGKTTNVTITL